MAGQPTPAAGGGKMKCEVVWFDSEDGFSLVLKGENGQNIAIGVAMSELMDGISFGSGKILKSKKNLPVDLLEKIWK